MPGESVRVRADGFAPDGIIDLYVDDVDRVVDRADDGSVIDVGLELPSDLALGTYWVTAIERASDRALQTRLLVDASTTWLQLGGDPGRTGHAIPGPGLSTALVGELHEVWYRDLEVLEPGEEIFVTDVAGEVAIPAIVDGDLLVSTWNATDIMSETGIVRRVTITATDVVTGSVRWRRVAESASFEDLSFARRSWQRGRSWPAGRAIESSSDSIPRRERFGDVALPRRGSGSATCWRWATGSSSPSTALAGWMTVFWPSIRQPEGSSGKGRCPQEPTGAWRQGTGSSLPLAAPTGWWGSTPPTAPSHGHRKCRSGGGVGCSSPTGSRSSRRSKGVPPRP